MPGYNSNNNRSYRRSSPNLSRFQRDSDERKMRGLSSLDMFNQVSTKSGFLGLGSFGVQGQEAGYGGTLDEATTERKKYKKDTAEYNKINEPIQKAIGSGNNWKEQSVAFLEQNKFIKGEAGKGLMGMIGKTGLGKKAKAFGSKIATSALGTKAAALYAGAAPFVAPIMAGKAIYDFAGQQVDRYEGLEAGIKTGETALKDITSERNEAKSAMLGRDKELATLVEEKKGLLTQQLGSRAEQVLSGAERNTRKTGLETSDSSTRIENLNKQGIKTSYFNSSDALRRAKKSGNLNNANTYADVNQGLMGRAQGLQSDIDSMDQDRKDMKGMYQFSKMIRG